MRRSQYSFAAGEVEPGLWGREDMTFSDKALSHIENAFIRKTGGFQKRTGTGWVGDAASHTTKSRLLGFDYGLDQAYAIEMAHEVIRFIRGGAVLEDGGSPYSISSPYTSDQLADIGFASARDVMYLNHRSVVPKRLVRSGDVNWAISDTPFAPTEEAPTVNSVVFNSTDSGSGSASVGSTYVCTVVNDLTGEESLGANPFLSTGGSGTQTGTVTITFDSAPDTDKRYRVYKDAKSQKGIYGFIGETAKATFIDTGFSPVITDVPPSDRQPFATSGNYPECVSFHQQRLVFASTDNAPDLIEFSRSALFANFTLSRPSKATDSMALSINDDQAQRVRHLISLRGLLVMTTAGLWVLEGTGDNRILVPGEVSNDPQIKRRGASNVKPVVIGKAGIYTVRDRRTVRDVGYSFADEGYVGVELSAPSFHLFESARIVDMAYAEHPHSVIWFILDDGSAVTLTYMREHEVFGWCRQTTLGSFESVTVLEENDGSFSAPYFVVKRTIGGVLRRFIERMHERDVSTMQSGIFMDCSLSYSGDPVSTVVAPHLASQDGLVALADGSVLTDLTADGSGNVALSDGSTEYSEVHLGLPFSTTVRTLPFSATTSAGSGAAKRKVASEVAVRVHRTLTFKARCYTADAYATLPPYQEFIPHLPQFYGGQLVRHSGIARVPLSGTWDEDGMIELVSDQPINFECYTMHAKYEVEAPSQSAQSAGGYGMAA